MVIPIHDLADLADAGLTQMRGYATQQVERRGGIPMNAMVRGRQRAQQPGPYGALVIGGVALHRAAAVATDVAAVARGEGAQIRRPRRRVRG